ncbi:iron-containing alcohol dehydrogenase [Tranquillimonas rosea]|uniref:iron-containing alcohol dehydrogenase n=1 Tax=Tranquillimonas rosea TaxID=641238 RepID=UPI003BACEFE5
MTLAPFAFRTAATIRFGRGTAPEAVSAALAHGTRVLVVHGRTAARADWLVTALQEAGAEVHRIACAGEPDLAALEAATDTARVGGVQVVIGLGGGAALDLAKAAAALAPSTSEAVEHLEIVGSGRPLDTDPLPFIAVPTTAGTGSEVTKNAVIGIPDHARKVSLRDERMLARLAIVDPALTDGLPNGVTLASGLDAVTQVIEPYLSHRATPLTDAICADAIPRGAAALTRLMRGEDAGARDEMAYVSLCGGVALANAGLGAVHGFAGVLGGRTGAPHGEICASLLPHVLTAHAARAGDDPALSRRLDAVRGWLAGALDVAPAEAFDTLAGWSRRAGIRGLGAMGVAAADLDEIVEASAQSSSMKANPYPPEPQALRAILEQALG